MLPRRFADELFYWCVVKVTFIRHESIREGKNSSDVQCRWFCGRGFVCRKCACVVRCSFSEVSFFITVRRDFECKLLLELFLG